MELKKRDKIFVLAASNKRKCKREDKVSRAYQSKLSNAAITHLYAPVTYMTCMTLMTYLTKNSLVNFLLQPDNTHVPVSESEELKGKGCRFPARGRWPGK